MGVGSGGHGRAVPLPGFLFIVQIIVDGSLIVLFFSLFLLFFGLFSVAPPPPEEA